MTTGFVISWVSWLSCVTMPPIEVQAVLQYSSTYFPALMHTVNQTPVLSNLGLALATLIMLALCILNIASFKGFIRFNFFIFAFKILVIVLTIAFFIHTEFHPQNFIGAGLFPSTHHWEAILSAVATGGIIFAFTGFKHGVELAGEVKNSRIAVPLSIIGSVTICLILYVGLQIAFIGVLNPANLTLGWSHLVFSHDVGPFVGLAGLLGLTWLIKLLLVDAAVSPLGAGLIYVTSTSRIIYAMSLNGYLPKLLSRVNAQQFPIVAIFFNFAVGMFLFLPLPGWQNMVSFLVSAVVVSYAMGPIALMSLRRQLPNIQRPFKLPFATVLCFLAFYCCNLISYWTGWDTLSKLIIAMLVGGLFFAFASFRAHHTEKKSLDLKALIWLIPYFIGLVTISYLGNFGGKNIITFGWDFLIIAIFSAVIFYLAIYARLPVHQVETQFELYRLEK